jgi:upstream-binding transcription factor
MVELGQKWKSLDDSKKQPYLSKYEKESAKYKEDMETFKAKLGPEGLREYINKKHEAKQAKQEKALKKLHRAQRDPNMPKRPMTSFFIFCKEFRAENGSKLPEKIAEQSQYLSKLWKEMSESQKQVTDKAYYI